MFLSIIIPVYNSTSFVGECIDSCLKQDIDKSDYEIICIDDRSTDNSFDIVKGYEKEYPNVKALRLEKNSGPSAARNAGLDLMRGDYCLFLDSDDFLAENCLKELKELSNRYDMVEVGRFVFDNGENGVEKGEYIGIPKLTYITGRVISRKTIEKIRFLESAFYGEDELFLFEIERRGATKGEYDKPTYYYRVHSGSAMAFTPEKHLKRIDSVLNSAEYLIKNYSPYAKETVNFINNRIRVAFSEIVGMKFKQRKSFVKNLKKRGLYNRRLDKEHVIGKRTIYLKMRIKHLIVKYTGLMK